MDLGNAALVTIDLQNGILFGLPSKGALLDNHDVLARNEQLIRAVLGKNRPVAMVHVTAPSFLSVLTKSFSKLSINPQILENPNVKIFEKHQPSAYSITAFRDFLKEKQIRTVLLTGVSTNNGVLKTARNLAENEINVITVTDATNARSEVEYNEALNELGTLGELVTTAELLNMLDKESKPKTD